MHVGYTASFQNPGGARTDAEVYDNEIALIDLSVELGFDSVWVVEHHFTDYFLSPNPVQFLTWLAARHPEVQLGTGVIVLPWHDPVRCAEEIIMLDNLSGGRLILGMGRGLGRTEYDGLRVEMDTSRERFSAYAEMIIDGLDSGFVEATNDLLEQPRRELRPRPMHSFRGRTYAAAMSPESMPIMARLGVGVLVVPQKPWDIVQADLETYRTTWREVHGSDVPVPAPLCAGNVVVDADPDRAEELAYRHIGGYYHTVIDHYGFNKNAHEGINGYEFYASIGKRVDKRGADGAVRDYVELMPYGTPDQVLTKLERLKDMLGIAAFNPSFNFAAMSPAEAESSMRLFATEVLPQVRAWEAESVGLQAGAETSAPAPV